MKSRVQFALLLFLHLLVHPILHAGDMRSFVPSQASSIRVPAGVVPATPECAICHVANGGLQVCPFAQAFVSDFESNAVVQTGRMDAVHEGVRSNRSPRAPPTA